MMCNLRCSPISFLLLGIVGCLLFSTSRSENEELMAFPVYEGDTRPGDVWPKPQSMNSTSKVSNLVDPRPSKTTA